MAKKQYTAAEKAAFNAGRGYAIAKEGKRVPNKTPETKASFRAGVDSVRKK